jgi:predicted ribosome quality control (RQC) complex YloA/Tae2 family protein
MHFDALSLACMADELRNTICPGRVQQVLLPDANSVGMEIFAAGQRRYLFASLHPDASRIALVQEKLRRGVEKETPLLLLLRKYVRDGILTAVEQPDPFERALWMRCEHRQHGATTLVIEPMGRLSNLLLLKANGMILECLHHVPAGEHAQRVLLPGRIYAPPTQAKLPPLDDGQPDTYERLGRVVEEKGLLWKALTTHVAGVSPTLAREVAWRAAGRSDAPASSVTILAMVQALQELWSPLKSANWQPGVWIDGGEVVGFSAYPAHLRGEFSATATMSEAVERYYTNQRGRAGTQRATASNPSTTIDGYAAQRQAVESLLRKANARVLRQQEALAGDEPAPGTADRLRSQAEWLLALHTRIEPHQQTLVVDLGADGTLEIALDPALTPISQAQRMFKQATRLARAAQFIPTRRAQLQLDLEFLAQVQHDLQQAQNQPEIAAVRAELEQSGLAPTQQQKHAAKERKTPKPAGASAPRSFMAPDGATILVGSNARQNERVTFSLAHGNDLWLHARAVPGSHVVIRCDGRAIDDATVRLAAQLAAYYSSVQGEAAVDVIVARVRDVNRLPGGRPGQVTVRQEQVLRVPAILPDEVVRL